jgi:hypothetical protein
MPIWAIVVLTMFGLGLVGYISDRRDQGHVFSKKKTEITIVKDNTHERP